MKKLRNLGRSLSKIEQKKILGGDYGNDGYCNITADGYITAIQVTGTCSEHSAQANSYCVNLITQGYANRCGYDCACDGIGH